MSGYSIAVTGNVPVNVPINFVTNSGTAISSSNNINVVGAGGTSTSGSGNTVTITTTSGVMTWTDQPADFPALVNNGYFCTAGLTMTLPGGATQGQTISIICDTSSPVILQADVTQFIAIGAESSVIGGTATSTALGDNLLLVYRSASSTWWALEADATWLLM
jgi:hypothetical protein